MPRRRRSQPPRPEVAVNFALSADARVSTRAGTPANFTSPRDKARLLEIRATGDALLVGRKTVEADNMRMGLPDETLQRARLARGRSASPLRVILSRTGALREDHPVFACHDAPLLFFSTPALPPAQRDFLSARAELHLLDPLTPAAVLETLASRHGVRRVVCEGGPTLLCSLMEAGLVDEINVTWAPLLFGGMDAPSLTGPPGGFLPRDRRYRLEACEVIGDECYTRYRVHGKA